MVVTEEDMLTMLYGLMDGDNWGERQRMGWKADYSGCDWMGVYCDLAGNMNGIEFPLMALKTEDDVTKWYTQGNGGRPL